MRDQDFIPAQRHDRGRRGMVSSHFPLTSLINIITNTLTDVVNPSYVPGAVLNSLPHKFFS